MDRTGYSSSLVKSVAMLLFVAQLIVHLPFLIKEHFGESDAAQIANDSIKAAHNRIFSNLEYTVYSSPVYSGILKFSIQSGMLPASRIPRWLTLISLIASAAATVAAYVFVLRLSNSVLAGVGAASILQLMPPFWYSSIYGFPSIVSIAFLLGAVILLDVYLAREDGPKKLVLLLFCLISYLLAVLTKLDALMTSAIFVLPIARSNLSIRKKALLVLILGVVAMATYGAFIRYADSLVDSQHFTRSWVGVSTAYPSRIRALISKKNLNIIARAVGILSLPTALAGAFWIGWRKEWRAPILWLTLAALPLVVFWGSKPANSARHTLVPGVFLALVLALPLAMGAWRKWVWAGLLCAVCLVNYLYWPPNDDSAYVPSGRLLASTHLLQDKVRSLHRQGQAIAQLPYAKVAVVGRCHYHSYYRYEILRSDKLEYVSHTSSAEAAEWGTLQTLEMKNRDREEPRSYLFQCSGPDLGTFIDQGYFLVVDEPELADELARQTELEGKWMPLNQ